jgi:hypothetical protein
MEPAVEEDMTLHPGFFPNNLEYFRHFMNGPDGEVLLAVAKATAATRRKEISGSLIFKGKHYLIPYTKNEPSSALFQVDANSQKFLDNDSDTKRFIDLAPVLIQIALSHTCKTEGLENSIVEACRYFKVQISSQNIENSAKEIFNVYARGEFKTSFSRFVLVTRLNYFRVMEMLVSNRYAKDDKVIIPLLEIHSVNSDEAFKH